MWNVASLAAEGVKNLGKFAVTERTVKANRAQLGNGFISLACLEPGLIDVVGNEACLLEEGEAVAKASGCPAIVSSSAACISTHYGKTHIVFVLLWRLEEMASHLKNEMVVKVDKAEAAT